MISTVLRGHLRVELRKFIRERARVVRDYEFGFFPGRASLRGADASSPVSLVQISHEPARGATDVVKIHRVRPDAGKLRPPCSRGAVRRVAALCSGHNFSDRPTA